MEPGIYLLEVWLICAFLAAHFFWEGCTTIEWIIAIIFSPLIFAATACMRLWERFFNSYG